MFTKILESLCVSTTAEVFDSLTKLGFTYNGEYAFRPGKTKTAPLVVCHADTVVKGGYGPHPFTYKKGTAVSIALDDRLGIACMVDTIHKQAPMSDCAYLVCDHEEIGRSTAKLFAEDAAPNWMVELDRRGVDVVCYDYESVLFTSLLESVGFDVGSGSFSDISSLTHLGVVGFNMGVGYRNEHTEMCHAKLSDTYDQMSKLAKFYDRFGSIRLAYEPETYRYSSRDYRFDDMTDVEEEDLYGESYAWNDDEYPFRRY